MDAFIGEIRAFGFNFVPEGWLLCNGQQVPVRSYQALYAVIGNFYGGDSQNFKLPNLQGRVPASSGIAQGGVAPRVVGSPFGLKTVGIVDANMPQHTHGVTVQTANADVATPDATCYLAAAGFTTSGRFSKSPMYSTATSDKTLNPNALTAQSGGNIAHENRQPYLVMNMCICWDGLFPTAP